jgi:excisionase family DNA binding protein
MTTDEAAKRLDVPRTTLIKWAAKNGIKRVKGTHGIMTYVLEDDDLVRFQAREQGKNKGKGWPRGKSRKDDKNQENVNKEDVIGENGRDSQ